MFSCRGREKTVAGSSVEANKRVNFGPKHAAATRPLGTVHLSACHGVATPVFQILSVIINGINRKRKMNICIREGKIYLNIFLHVADNKWEPQDDHCVKHKPPPPTLFNGTPCFLDVSQTIILVSAGEQDTSRSPWGCHVTFTTGAWLRCFRNTAWLRELLAAPNSMVQTKTPPWQATANSLPARGLQLTQQTDFWALCLNTGTTGIPWENMRIRSSLVTTANRGQWGCQEIHLIWKLT